MVIKQDNSICNRVHTKFALFPKKIGNTLFIWEKYYKISFTNPLNNTISIYEGRKNIYHNKIDFYYKAKNNFDLYLEELRNTKI